MKGIVFTEFLEMVEKEYGIVVLDNILSATPQASQRSYTAVGTYPYHEFFHLLTNLSKETNTDIGILTHAFGGYLFQYFTKKYMGLLEHINSTFNLLDQLENHIHVEVKKLYPDAELPYFETISKSDKQMILHYRSKRSMSDFALGLIDAASKFYNENLEVQREFLSEDGSWVSFTLVKQ